jgi:hypothetical protein
MDTFFAALMPKRSKDGLEGDLEYVVDCTDEVDTDELQVRMTRIRRDIEGKHKKQERVLAMRYAQQCVYDSKNWRRVYNGLKLLDVVSSSTCCY